MIRVAVGSAVAALGGALMVVSVVRAKTVPVAALGAVTSALLIQSGFALAIGG
jgi:hypothetical protein